MDHLPTVLTAKEADDLAHHFTRIANVIRVYRTARKGELTSADYVSLSIDQERLLNMATRMSTMTIELLLAETADALGKLRQVTDDAAKALERIADMRQVLGIATALANVATVIAVGNGINVAGAMGDLAAAMKPKRKAK